MILESIGLSVSAHLGINLVLLAVMLVAGVWVASKKAPRWVVVAFVILGMLLILLNLNRPSSRL